MHWWFYVSLFLSGAVLGVFAWESALSHLRRFRQKLQQAQLPQGPDPLNPPPRKVQPILFADDFKVTPQELFTQGLSFTVDGRGRIYHIWDANKQTPRRSVEDYFGGQHGARIS